MGTVFSVQAISKNRDSQKRCQRDICDPTGGQARSAALTDANRATVAFVVSGVLIGGGAALFFLSRPSSAASPTAFRITPVVEPGGLALIGTTRF